jgi:integrase
MLARYKNGCLQKIKRKDGIERWQLRWNALCPDGVIRERKKTIGSVSDYPEDSKKFKDRLADLRLSINSEGPTDLTAITMARAIQHYTLHELSDSSDSGKAYSTRRKKTQVFDRWVIPRWGKLELGAIKTVAVEQWLKSLMTTQLGKPKPLAGGSKRKIRDAMSSVFNHAIRWEFTDRNPIRGPVKGSGVRVSGKREQIPDVLEVEEMKLLLGALELRERTMVFLDMGLGLRRGELAGIKWEDVNFEKLSIDVMRSVVDQQVGDTKTEVSRKPVPIDESLALDLRAWRERTPYREPTDWVFATDSRRAGAKRGKQPLWLSTIMRYHIQPKARELGVRKKISWHTFRHTYSTLLRANGEDVKVVQELLRHASAKMTLDIYSQALTPAKRAAQSKVVSMIFHKAVPRGCTADSDPIGANA